MLGIVEEKSITGKPLVHLLVPPEGQMDSGKPSSSAGDVQTRSPSGHRLVSVRGRVGHAPCGDVPGGQTLLSTSASKEFMSESSGLSAEM